MVVAVAVWVLLARVMVVVVAVAAAVVVVPGTPVLGVGTAETASRILLPRLR
jgi:hypothetical protein